MKIIKLEANNILRLSAVEITPDGNTIIIGGKNGAGKTSVLNSIEMALGGTGSVPPKPVKDGAEKGNIVVDLGDIIVERKFNSSGESKLIVKNKEGAVYQSPQAMLDALLGKLTFDPLKFSNLDEKTQLGYLKKLVGLDFTEMDKGRAELYSQRTFVNRDLNSKEIRLKEMDFYKDIPEEKPNAENLTTELREIIGFNMEIEKSKIEFEKINCELAEMSNKIKEMERRRNELEKRSADVDKACSLEPKDAKSIEFKLIEAEFINKKTEANRIFKLSESEVIKTKSESLKLTNDIEKIDKDKQDAISKAKFPIEGLGFDETGVTFNKMPFKQLSSAEQLKVSVAMGIAFNPKIKVMLIRDGSLLDEDNLKVLQSMAKDSDTQIWLEMVGRDKECQVVIEDGAVKK